MMRRQTSAAFGEAVNHHHRFIARVATGDQIGDEPSFSAKSFCATPDNPGRVVWMNLSTFERPQNIAARRFR